MISRFNRWYDNLKEPLRFAVAMAICTPWFISIGANEPVAVLGGFFYVMFLITMRVWWTKLRRG